MWGTKLWGAKISSNLPNLDLLCLNWPFGVEIGLYLRQIASKIGQLNSLTNCLVFLVSLGQISLVNFYLVSKPRNFCSLFLVSYTNSLPKNTATAKLYALHRPVRVHDNSSDWGFSDDLCTGRLCGTGYWSWNGTHSAFRVSPSSLCGSTHGLNYRKNLGFQNSVAIERN